MTKNNSPAFNFYSSDFLTETTFFTLEQTGAYIKLLCYQHQFEYLTKEQILSVTNDEKILEKFCEKNGKFFNKKLKEIIDKKKAHCDKQRANALKRWGKTDDTNVMPSHKFGNTNAMPLENEIVIENENNIFSFIEDNFSRTINSIEYEIINTWEDNELTRYAIKQAVLNSVLNIKYIDTILKSYKQKGIRSVVEAQEDTKRFKQQRKGRYQTKEERDEVWARFLEGEEDD